MKKIISLVLSVVMIFTIGSVSFGVDAFAEEAAPETNITSQIPEEVLEVAPIFANSLMQTLGYLNFSNFRLPTSSDDFVDMLLKFLYGIVDVLIDVILKSINLVVPSIDFADKDFFLFLLAIFSS